MAHLIRSQLVEGTWTGEVTGLPQAPDVEVTLHDRIVNGVGVAPGHDDSWLIHVPVPPEAIADGSHSFLVTQAGGELLATFTILAGDVVTDDLRTEISLLRAELDMMKKAFRMHVLETMG
ncbi:MAG: hypothetical protein AAF386_03710 [Pseudomonadota bacterium]